MLGGRQASIIAGDATSSCVCVCLITSRGNSCSEYGPNVCVCVCLITGLEWVTPERSMAHLSLLPAILRERLRLIDTV